MNRAVFLDRDGVINQKAPGEGYVTTWEQIHFLPDSAKAISLLNRAGFLVIVVTNQRCVAKGLITIRDLETLHRRMCEKLAMESATVDAIFYCPHQIEPPCACRKPAPGMFFEAAKAHQIALNNSWMVGDSEIDVKAGRNAGCKTARLSDSTQDASADIVAASLSEVVQQILRRERIAEISSYDPKVNANADRDYGGRSGRSR
ncbi:MAG TPA: HAD family hydrolase [Terriglobales bacterium]|nr:HAD family hydrolase [Terriglobales bacterium]